MSRIYISNVPRPGCPEVPLKELRPNHWQPQGAQGDPWCSHTLPAPFEHRSSRMPRHIFKSAWNSRRPSHAEASSCNPSKPKPVAESFASLPRCLNQAPRQQCLCWCCAVLCVCVPSTGTPRVPKVIRGVHTRYPPHLNTEAQECQGTSSKAHGTQEGQATQKQAAATPASPSQLQKASQATAMFSHA